MEKSDSTRIGAAPPPGNTATLCRCEELPGGPVVVLVDEPPKQLGRNGEVAPAQSPRLLVLRQALLFAGTAPEPETPPPRRLG